MAFVYVKFDVSMIYKRKFHSLLYQTIYSTISPQKSERSHSILFKKKGLSLPIRNKKPQNALFYGVHLGKRTLNNLINCADM